MTKPFDFTNAWDFGESKKFLIIIPLMERITIVISMRDTFMVSTINTLRRPRFSEGLNALLLWCVAHSIHSLSPRQSRTFGYLQGHVVVDIIIVETVQGTTLLFGEQSGVSVIH
jgi:hypothetical protein